MPEMRKRVDLKVSPLRLFDDPMGHDRLGYVTLRGGHGLRLTERVWSTISLGVLAGREGAHCVAFAHDGDGASHRR